MRLNGRSRARLLSAAAIFGLSFLAAPHAAHAQGAPDVGNPPYKYNKVFPFWGKKLAARGLTFPLPFGFGLNYAALGLVVDLLDRVARLEALLRTRPQPSGGQSWT